tara:strand:+ start:946 stop:1071 length:126 start_codon:yes stop_codon:yes gene_type:complete
MIKVSIGANAISVMRFFNLIQQIFGEVIFTKVVSCKNEIRC